MRNPLRVYTVPEDSETKSDNSTDELSNIVEESEKIICLLIFSSIYKSFYIWHPIYKLKWKLYYSV